VRFRRSPARLDPIEGEPLMFESFVIMLREGIEAALVIGIILVVLRRTQRKDLERENQRSTTSFGRMGPRHDGY